MRWLRLERCKVDLETGSVVGGTPDRLTSRELALLRLLVERAGKVVERQTVMCEAFGYAPNAASRAADKAMDSLRGKLERDKGAPVHLLTVFGVGYRFVPAASAPALRVFDKFIGREAELGVLRSAGPGLVTVLGPGGAGKTRLVREAFASDLALRFCDLLACRGDGDVLAEAERVLRLAAREGDRVERVADRLGADRLVLDNAEHVLDEVRALVTRWAPRVQVVVTSRVRLDLPGETVVSVGPLSAEDAADLFRDRAGVEADPDDVAAVVDLVEGLPLAIELAARRARLLPTDELRRRLAESPALLSTRAGTVPERHRDVRRVVAWSWGLLSDAERDALSQAALFRGGFDLAAAEAVLALGPGAPAVVDILQGLLDASLLRRSAAGRLDLYEVVRHFARGELRGEAGASARHDAWVARQA